MVPQGASSQQPETKVGLTVSGYFLWCFVFLGVVCLVQCVVVMCVVWCIVVPFWAVNVVGMFSLWVHRLPFAASAEFGPWGSVSSNVPTGSSGIAGKVELVIPFLLMNVSPCRLSVTP